ncbi:hypothetical protein M3Y95_00382200 [Aphelenchoides besseyi]|nr:hypothetical protein M3Y95_00382200 [Aphelenchoides besseyi]
MFVFVFIALTLFDVTKPNSIRIELQDDFNSIYDNVYDNGKKFNFQLGIQTFYGLVFPFFQDVIVIDSECGTTRNNCSRYCHEPDFCGFYCPIECYQRTAQSLQLVCPPQVSHYNRSASSTAKTLDDYGQWRAKRNSTHDMYAIYVQDILTLQNDTTSLSVSEFIFLSAMSASSNLFGRNDALIGMAPGSITQPNFIHKLHKNGQLNRPVVSFSRAALHSYAVIGDAEEFDCNQWLELSTVEENAWIFEFNEVKVMGRKFGKTKVLWNPVDSLSNMPQYVYDIFIHEKIFFYADGWLVANCTDDRPIIQFTGSRGQKLVITPADLFGTDAQYFDYCNVFAGVSESSSNFPVEWSLGVYFSWKHCHRYDFGSRTFAIGSKSDHLVSKYVN